MNKALSLFICIAALWQNINARQSNLFIPDHNNPDTAKAEVSFTEIRDTFTYRNDKILYMLILPAAYAQTDAKWPMILFMHGGSGIGQNLDLVKIYGPTVYAERKAEFPFVVLAPQCAEGQNWNNTENIAALLDYVLTKYNIDEDCVYLTGMSLGGYGAWNMAAAYPEYFAAVSPIASYWSYPERWAKNLVNMPIWTLHGDKDEKAPLENDVKVVEALRALGASPRFTILEGRGHDITDLYMNDEIYNWFLIHKRGN